MRSGCSMDDTPAYKWRQILETFWRREGPPTELRVKKGFSGAGYGDRTRLTGLGSQGITTMLSPLSVDLAMQDAEFRIYLTAQNHFLQTSNTHAPAAIQQ